MKIVLPSNNKWLDKYFNTKEAYDENNINKIKRYELERIIEASQGKVDEYVIEFEDRKYGQYFILENDNEIKWITVSADYTIEEDDSGSTNAYFVQYIPMALRAAYECKTTKNKKLELFLKGTSHPRATTQLQCVYYRMAKTIGIKILNANELNRVGMNISKEIENEIKSIDEWKNERLKTQAENTSNKSSYILEEEDAYIFYGKTFGANGRESIFILYLLSMLANKQGKKIYLYEVLDNGATAFEMPNREEDKRFKQMLESRGIIYYIDSLEYVDNRDKEQLLDEKDKDARHQAEFMRNLMIKYNAERDDEGNIKRNRNGAPIIHNTEKKCYICGCTIQRAIIASHIQRVTDINKLKIPFDEKRKKAIDGDNGFWLCANHDKMFEYGIITFDENTGRLQMETESLNLVQKGYIKEITKKMNISEEHFSNNLKHYLKIHNDRIKAISESSVYIDIESDEKEKLIADNKAEYKK